MKMLSSLAVRLIIVSMILGLILRLFFALTLPVGWDGGIFLYWANLINNGAIPYRDFFIRDPVYIYLVALSVRAFGSNYLAISLVSIVPSVLTVPVLYKIAKEVFDYFTGLASALIFSFAPTILWYSTVFDERSLMLFLSVLAMWALVKGLKSTNAGFLALFGSILGIGTFAYRGIAIYMVTLPLFLAFLTYKSRVPRIKMLKKVVFQSIVSWGSFLLAFGSIFVIFSFKSSFSWMVSNFGFSGQPESAGWFIWGQAASGSFKDRIFYVAVREWLYLIIPAAVFMLIALFRVVGRRGLSLGLAIVGVSAFLVATLAARTRFPQTSYGAYEPSALYLYSFLGLLVLLSGVAGIMFRSSSFMIRHSASGPERIPLGWELALFWFLSTAVLIVLFGIPLVNYYYYFAPSLSLIASPSVASAIRRIKATAQIALPSIMRQRGPILFLGLLLVNASITAAMLYTTPMTWRNQSIKSVYDIASYIQSNTSSQDQILVGNPEIALLAHRQTALGITQLQFYGRTGPEPFVPYPYDPFHLFPNVTQISEFMASGGVKYVVADYSPPTLYIIDLHPIWEAAFKTNFVLETVIDGVSIFRYNPTWDLSQHLDEVDAHSNSTTYRFVNQTFVDGYDHILISSELYSSLPTVGGTARSNQVMFHPPFVSGRSYIEFNLLGNRYSNLTTNFALADVAVGRSNGAGYSIQVSEGGRQLALLSHQVTNNTWQQSSVLLPTGTDLTIALTSDSGLSSSYDWLQITLTLLR